jgi:hypothetical protein
MPSFPHATVSIPNIFIPNILSRLFFPDDSQNHPFEMNHFLSTIRSPQKLSFHMSSHHFTLQISLMICNYRFLPHVQGTHHTYKELQSNHPVHKYTSKITRFQCLIPLDLPPFRLSLFLSSFSIVVQHFESTLWQMIHRYSFVVELCKCAIIERTTTTNSTTFPIV